MKLLKGDLRYDEPDREIALNDPAEDAKIDCDIAVPFLVIVPAPLTQWVASLLEDDTELLNLLAQLIYSFFSHPLP